MASGHEVHVTINAARDLKNVNWRHGPNKPYAIVWVDPTRKMTTKVDKDGHTCPHWDETLVVPLPGPHIDHDTALFVDIVNAEDHDDTKKLIGSASLKLVDVINETGFDEPLKRSLTLKRPSGRPHGKIDVKVTIREPSYQKPAAYYPQPPPPAVASREYGHSFGQPPPPPPMVSSDYGQQPLPSGYPYFPTAQPAPPMIGSSYSYGNQGAGNYGGQEMKGAGYYGGEQTNVAGHYGGVQTKEKKKFKFGGMGTGLAVGAVAGALGGLALAEGIDKLEDKISDDVATKIEEDIGYDSVY